MLLSWLVVKLERLLMGDGLMPGGFGVNHGDGRLQALTDAEFAHDFISMWVSIRNIASGAVAGAD